MKRGTSILVAGGLVCIGFAAWGVQAATELARINNTVISLEDFNKKYQESLKFFQFRAPTKSGVLEDLIKRELAVQEAKKEGLDRDPMVVEQINTVLYHALLDRQLSKEFEAIHISDGEAKSFYSKNPEIRTSHIFVAVPPHAKPEDEKAAREKIERAAAELHSGKESFAEVAQKYSDGPSAPMGGDIDYQTRDKLDPTYYETAIRLRPGQVSGIIRSQFGYHVIKLTAIRSWDDVDKVGVKRALFDVHRADIFEKYMKTLRRQARVQIHPELLKN